MYDSIQTRLFRWAGLFLFIFSVILTVSPAARALTWDVDYRLSHWVGFFAWSAYSYLLDRASSTHLRDRDPYFLPAASLLAGWGLLTIWRLDETFGIRQTIWMGIAVSIFIFALRHHEKLPILRRYKYVLLAGGLLVTALTLIFGTNPYGIGPRLWLGCCGVYLQPSEPLKLLLVIYLAAYFADRAKFAISPISLLAPMLFVTGLALVILLVQRDLGTASIFVAIFTLFIFLATGKRRVLFAVVSFFILALLVGYFFIDVVHVRVDSWLNPWADPAGNSYQIVQSLIAVANGGVFGRGPGMGSPLLVPVAISDFIFSAIAEETGLLGTTGLLALIWLILIRGLSAAIHGADRFKRLLATGIVSYFGVQSLLIIGGNLRLLPLTGVTLPFVSYGGSSLVTSYIALFFLLTVSAPEGEEPAQIKDPTPYATIGALLAMGIAACALSAAWWTIIRGPDLLSRTDNARRAIADRYVQRGQIVDRNNTPINFTSGESGTYQRLYAYPELSPVSGYTHPVFGQAGLESSLDDYLRGIRGYPASTIWWNYLLYGAPPPGLDVRLSIDLSLQTLADSLLGNRSGAIILMNAETGEILAIASHPTFDPAKLDEEGDSLSQNKSSPLVNRASQGLYPIGTVALPFIRAQFGENSEPSDAEMKALFQSLGFYQAPVINMPVAVADEDNPTMDHRISPLQLAMAGASFSTGGMVPAPRIAMAVNTPAQGWVSLPAMGTPFEADKDRVWKDATRPFIVEGKPYWSHTGQSSAGKNILTWLVAGTLPDWGGVPLTLSVVLEENNIFLAEHIRDEMLK